MKIKSLIIVMLLFLSLFIIPNFTEEAEAIGQHEASDGTTTGEIHNETIVGEGVYFGSWELTGANADPAGMATDGTSIWVVDMTDDAVYKYDMNGGYIDSWALTVLNAHPAGITTDGTNIWVVDYIVGAAVYKYNMVGGYINSWELNAENNFAYDMATDGTNIWVVDSTDNAVYKYDMVGGYIGVWGLTVLNTDPAGMTTDGTNIWVVDYDEAEVFKYTMDGQFTDIHWDTAEYGNERPFGMTTDGTNIWVVDSGTADVYKYIKPETFIATRTASAATESNNFSFIPDINYADNVILRIPVSTSVKGIIDVTNNTGVILATEVNTSDELINNTFWYDSANQFVYIRTINLTTSTTVNWTVNCSYGVTFSLIIPSYLEVGQYFESEGFISDSIGNAISGMIAETRLLYVNGTDALAVNPKHNCTGGNYKCTFSTSTLIPGVYSVSIEFTDSSSGITFKEGSTLYLSVDPGHGVHVAGDLIFHFYDSNTGLGLEPEEFKIYADDDSTLTEADRIYDNRLVTYTGDTIYYRIDDYFNNTVYPLAGSYETVSIVSVTQHENIPITWYDLLVKNMNNTIMYFTMTNGSRTYPINLFPMDSIHIKALPGIYDITKYYYSALNGSFLYSETDTIVIAADMFYVATGYDAELHVSWYNTNEGLGLPDETLKFYIDGVRQTSMTYWSYINRTINITVKDYYNTTLYTGNYTLNGTHNFIDLGLTFHSWKFCNKNDLPYIVSFLKQGGSRWYEVGICPYETIEFIVPSGTYTLRIYDNSSPPVEIYNQAGISVVNSRVYLIHGTNLSELISGQSVIQGQLLEVRSELDYALTPDVIIVSCNPPIVYSPYDTEGMAIGNGIYRICPALITIATTRVETTGNWLNSTARIPSNDTVENGTITLLKDSIIFEGDSITWCNITYTGNGTLLQNTSYLPNKLFLYGQNVTINASGDITITRESKYNQHKKFYWTFNSFTGEHTAGIDVINPMNVPIVDVYIFVEFSNQSIADGNTVEIRDDDNGGRLLERGINFDVSNTGIHFYLLSINSDATRGFAISYYKSFDDSYRYGEGKVTIPMYEETVWNGDSYNTFMVSWINEESTIFRGGLYIKLDFDISTAIDFSSIRIWDEDNNREIDSGHFVFGSDFIRIGADGVGDVNPGGRRSFTAYFLFQEHPGADPTEVHLNTPIATINGFPITIFMIIVVVGLCMIGIGFYDLIDKKNVKRSKAIIVLGIFITFIFSVIAGMGV